MSETRRTGTDAIKSYKKDALKKLRDTFQKVMRIKKELGQRGLPEPEINQRINKFIAKKGYNRQSLEEGIRFMIDKDVEASDNRFIKDKFSGEFAKAVAREVAAGATYEFADEVEAFVRAIGRNNLDQYDSIKNEINEERGRFQEQDPVATGLMNLSGGMIGGTAESALLPASVVPKVMATQAGQPIRNIAKNTLTGTGVGAGSGALTAAGADQDVGSGALIGGATGGVLTPAIQMGTGVTKRAFAGGGGGQAQAPSTTNPFDPNNRALRKILTSYQDDFQLPDTQTIAEARRRTQGFIDAGRGDTVMPTDIGENNIIKTTDALISVPGPAATLLDTQLTARQMNMRPRLQGSLESNLGIGADPTRFERMAKARRAELSPQYQAIEKRIVNDPAIQRILETDPIALKGYEDMIATLNRTETPNPGSMITESGAIRPGPYTLEEVEIIRKGLGDRLSKTIVQKGYLSGEARRATEKNYARLVNASDRQVPEYGDLRRQGFDEYEMSKLNQLGYDDVIKMKPSQLEDTINGIFEGGPKSALTENEMRVLRSGFVERIVKDINDGKADTGDYTRIFNSPNMKEKLDLLFSEPAQNTGILGRALRISMSPTTNKRQQFQSEIDAEKRFARSFAKTRGSRTAETTASQNELAGQDYNEMIQQMGAMSDMATTGGVRNLLPMIGPIENALRRREMRSMSEQMGPRMSGIGSDQVFGLLDELDEFTKLQQRMAQEDALRSYRYGSGFGSGVTSGLMDEQ